MPRHFTIAAATPSRRHSPPPPQSPTSLRVQTHHESEPTRAPFIAMGTKNLTRKPPASMATAPTALLLSLTLLASAAVASPSPDADAISRFQEYLRIDTAQPAPDYAAAVAFLRGQAAEAGIEARTLELAAGKPLSAAAAIAALDTPQRRAVEAAQVGPPALLRRPRIYARVSQVSCTSLLRRLIKAAIFACLV